MRIVLVTFLALVLSFGTGFVTGRFGDIGKSESDIVDTSSVDRIIKLARSGLIEERLAVERERAELDRSRELDNRERERIVTDRTAVAEIEKRCRDSIRILEQRAESVKVER